MLLQAMMALPFVFIGLFIFVLFTCIIFVFLFNNFQPKIFPNNPKKIDWYWVLILPVLIMLVITVWFLCLPEDTFRYT